MDTETIPHWSNSQEDFWHSRITYFPPRSQDLDSPLQFLAILNMLAALVYISQASSTRVLPLECSRNAPEAGPRGNTAPEPKLRLGILASPGSVRLIPPQL